MSRAIGRRYAKALLDLAVEQNNVDTIRKGLDNLGAVWAESPELREVFENPAISTEQRKAVLEAISKRLMLVPVVQNTLRLLSDRRRMRFLPDLVTAFANLAEERTGTVSAEVVTAVPMPEAYYQQVQKALESTTGRKIVIHKKQDPAIIGGVITRLGDRIYDGSLRTRLNELHDELLAR